MQSKSKKFYIGLNPYRNAHFHVLNKTKKEYKELLQPQIQQLPTYKCIEIAYTLFPKTKRLCDISNILSIHDKYFCDALVEAKKIPEDNYIYIPEVRYSFGEIDKENPRVEINIQEIKK